jgi:hypothetical protein
MCVYTLPYKYIHGTYMYICMYVDVHTCCYVLPRWTQEELKKVIAMLHDPEFDLKDIDPDLHKRMDQSKIAALSAST